jgi:hypothetical protein
MLKYAHFLAAIAILGIVAVSCSPANDPVGGSSNVSVSAQPDGPSLVPGNGAPNGQHYNLNLIGISKDKTAPMDDNNGHRIFVKLWGKTKIMLAEGDDFQVLDANGTDGNGAAFQLPDPDPDDDLVTSYSVYARALGTPGGWSTAVTCMEDDSGETYCSGDTLTLSRSHGKQHFTNVSQELLTLNVDLDGDGVLERVGLFDDELFGYYWDYDNNGLKLAQLRFYPVTTDVGQ